MINISIYELMRISENWLLGKGINPEAFNYIEEFLFAIKYLQSASTPYFPPYRGSGGKSDPEMFKIKIAEVLSVKDNFRSEVVKKFWFYFYDQEMEIENIANEIGFSVARLYHVKNPYRLQIVTAVECGTLLVPPDAYWIKDEDKKEEISNILRR